LLPDGCNRTRCESIADSAAIEHNGLGRQWTSVRGFVDLIISFNQLVVHFPGNGAMNRATVTSEDMTVFMTPRPRSRRRHGNPFMLFIFRPSPPDFALAPNPMDLRIDALKSASALSSAR
jgi:hypothetical protein